ncbi:MAG: RNA 3'-terminal phosphate cyclase [Candidatus Aenigmarchaeota archaeon]|nr:RNA 3'-terminal phosphate cyclase [Candidatus Aenigmarchaeota archaeon]
MITIDGSLGGGQLLRTAVSLSALTGEAVKITNIRKGKAEGKPGLRPQHLMGIKVLGEFCQAMINGLEENSLEVEFIPQKLKVYDKKINIGTAGNIGLLLQTLTPLLLFNDKPVTLEIIGGTETKWSPTIQYIKYVTYPILNKMGANLSLEIIKHGYYPKGGGKVVVTSRPVERLIPFNYLDRGEIKDIQVHSTCGHLPKDVAERQGKSALSTIQYYCPKTKISMVYESVESLSPGSSVTCYANCDYSVLGGDYLGEMGLKAEVVGQRAAEGFLKSLNSRASLDKFMADQILVFLALAKGKSQVKVEEITEHCRTNIQVIEEILPIEFEIDKEKKEISVEGIGLKY